MEQQVIRGKLQALKKLRYLYLDKVENVSDLMEILSLKNLTRLKLNMPRECELKEIDIFLASLKEQLPDSTGWNWGCAAMNSTRKH